MTKQEIRQPISFSKPVILLLCFMFCISLTGCKENQSGPDDLALASEYMRQRDFIEAEKSFERYLRRNPNGEARWEVWNRLVELALTIRHDRNSAIELLEAMMMEYETDAEKRREIQNKLAKEYELSRRYDRAVSLWASLAKDPETPLDKKASSYRNLARIYLRRLEFELAKEVLGYCMELNIPQSAKSNCQYDLADAHMIMEDLDAGIRELRNLLEQKDVEHELRILAIFMLADALEQQGNRETALGLFESVRFSYPNSSVIESRIDYLKRQGNQ